MKIDRQKANAAIDEFLKELRDPNKMPTQVSSRTYVEFLLERHGIIADVRKLKFGESHVIWYACLILTGRVREVSRAETKANLTKAPGLTTENTIRRIRKGNLRTTIASPMLETILKENQ